MIPPGYAPEHWLAVVRRGRSDRSDGAFRGVGTRPQCDLSDLRQVHRTGSRFEGVAADPGRRPDRCAATGCAACAGRVWAGSADGRCRGAGWIARQAAGARSVFSVCTGALLCGAAGLLRGRRATTHWASFHLLPLFGAIAVNERVVVDGNWVFAAGVTAGIDGALRLAAELRGADVAKSIQLHMVYAPEPPFDSGTPETATPAILAEARRAVAGITAQREATARRVASRLGIAGATTL